MQKTLIIHHLEITWEAAYQNKGTNFETLAYKTIKWIKRHKPDRVILTQFENWQPSDEHFSTGIANYVHDWYDYGYGWEFDELTDLEQEALENDNIGINWAWGGEHSEVVRLDDWMYTLANDQVYICGAFDGECIEDLQLALDAVNVNYKRIPSLIL